jgi:regulator of sigma E protease
MDMADLLLKTGSIVVLLGGLIFVHELGHFLVAKALGVKVLRFSIGFGPRLLGFRRGETEYRISALPLGGYVKMAGDDPSEPLPPEDQGRGFLEQAPWRRLLIAFAGPAMNLIFPGVIYLGLVVAQNGTLTAGPVVGTVAPGSPAATAGLRPGDQILTVAAPGQPARPVRYFSDLRDLVAPHPDESLTFRVQRDGAELAPLTIVPESDEDSNPIETTRRGIIGVTPFYPPAIVAPVRAGAAGPLQPFDLVVSAGGAPIRHVGELSRAVAAAGCGPLDLEVVREEPVALPGATLSTPATARLERVPTCVDGKPSFLPADANVSTFVASVAPGSPADAAGLRRGDAITAVNGKPVRSFRDVNAVGRAFQIGQPVELSLLDGRKVELVPAKETYVDDMTKERAERMLLGFEPDRRAVASSRALVVAEVPLRRGPGEAVAIAWKQLSEVVRLTVLGIQRIVTRQISFKTVGGPLMLFSIASEAAEEGWASFLFKMALISVNLGLMNLLPIPVLDGGHIAQAAVEGITRRPLSLRAREIANIVGLILLFTLMIFVFKNDLVRVFG